MVYACKHPSAVAKQQNHSSSSRNNNLIIIIIIIIIIRHSRHVRRYPWNTTASQFMHLLCTPSFDEKNKRHACTDLCYRALQQRLVIILVDHLCGGATRALITRTTCVTKVVYGGRSGFERTFLKNTAAHGGPLLLRQTTTNQYQREKKKTTNNNGSNKHVSFTNGTIRRRCVC
jgi:hypothetical protein